jgi:hypothetical protein
MGLFLRPAKKVRGNAGAGDGANRATVGIELTPIAPAALSAWT